MLMIIQIMRYITMPIRIEHEKGSVVNEFGKM